jgi:hypothetical protein
VSARVLSRVVLTVIVSALQVSLAHGQPMMGGGGGGMPDLRAIAGKPLPDKGMPTGMVTVRVARKAPANGVADVEITAIVEGPSGESRKRTAKTDASGRATFEGLPAGHRFHAQVTVDREKLETETFPIPDVGGIRTMLIAALPADGAGPADAAGKRPFSLGLIVGTVTVAENLPTGIVEVLALDEQNRPLAQQAIELGKVVVGREVEVSEVVTGADGHARFSNVTKGAAPTGAGGAAGHVAAAVVMERNGLRIGTEGFNLPDKGGVSVELRVPQRTPDPSILSIGAGGRVILQVREDGLGFIETLPLENHSDKVFDPGVGGLEIPLPTESVNAEGAEGEHKIEIRKGIGVAVHGPIPPRRPETMDPSRKSPDEVTFGFVLPATGATRDFEQRFPNGLGEFTFVTDQVAGLSIESPQITGRKERDFNGKKYWLMRGEPIPAGGTLRFTVHGLPAPDNTGRIIAGVLALALVGGAGFFSRRTSDRTPSKEGTERERLIQRREKLFSDLLTREGRTAGDAGLSTAARTAAKTERDELVRKLEGVYRELTALDERRA